MSELLTVRYPSGVTEFRSFDSTPEPGDIFRRNGDRWVVSEVAVNGDRSRVITLSPLPVAQPEDVELAAS